MVELAGSGDMVGVNAGELLTAAATDELLMAAPVQSKRQKIVKKRYKATLIHSMHNRQFTQTAKCWIPKMFTNFTQDIKGHSE